MSKVYVLIEKGSELVQQYEEVDQGLLTVFDTSLNAEAAIPHYDKNRLKVSEGYLIGPDTAEAMRHALETLEAAVNQLDSFDPWPEELKQNTAAAISSLTRKLT